MTAQVLLLSEPMGNVIYVSTRAEQRAQTKQRIVEAAIGEFGEHGFDGASTRAIAASAGVTQGLIGHYFVSKEDLWRSAVDHLFSQMFPPGAARAGCDAPGPAEALRAFVRFSAARPEMLSIMVDAGRRSDDTARWLSETYLTPLFTAASALARSVVDDSPETAASFTYALIGACSMIFAVRNECLAVTGIDPLSPAQIEHHADLIVRLFTKQ